MKIIKFWWYDFVYIGQCEVTAVHLYIFLMNIEFTCRGDSDNMEEGYNMGIVFIKIRYTRTI